MCAQTQKLLAVPIGKLHQQDQQADRRPSPEGLARLKAEYHGDNRYSPIGHYRPTMKRNLESRTMNFRKAATSRRDRFYNCHGITTSRVLFPTGIPLWDF
jgi:hypothetical protein